MSKKTEEQLRSSMQRKRQKYSLELFHKMAAKVPAYRDFLRSEKVISSKIRSYADLRQVPPVTKDNYLKRYKLESLLWKGGAGRHSVFTSTSGSTGTPFYFPRDERMELHAAEIHKSFLDLAPRPERTPTMVIVAFGMGVWIGGMLTYKAFEMVARTHGYPISIITPGINKKEVVSAFRSLAGKYKRVILCGYPPFIKDVLDELISEKISLSGIDMQLLFAAEAFTENFRDHVAKLAGIEDVLTRTMNIYGTADLGAMAWETPASISVRRVAMERGVDIFNGASKTPTLAQFRPEFVDFEELQGELLLTGDSALPLFKYGIGDHGGVMWMDDVRGRFRDAGISIDKELKLSRAAGSSHLPFVYVYERKDFSTTLYGLQIYPEPIRELLISAPFSALFTGKFSMVTRFNKAQDQYLEINVELKKGDSVSVAVSDKLKARMVDILVEKNSEFRELLKHLGKRAWPEIVYWPAEHPLHFKPGTKQKWIIRP